jgi:hypothetical protein
MATWEATLWVVVLLVQSLPYAASVSVSLIAAAQGRVRAAAPKPVPVRAVEKMAAGD